MPRNARESARRHAISHDRPCPSFFSGALLGNGGLGAVVTTRPDGIEVHFGHNDVWDIRVSMRHAERIGTFAEIFRRVMAIQPVDGRIDRDPWLTEYCDLMMESYSRPYPRPFPCGSLILGFDRRRVELFGHSLDIANGMCRVDLRVGDRPAAVELFVDMEADRLWIRCRDENGRAAEAPFDSIRLLPDPDGHAGSAGDLRPGPEILPGLPTGALGFRQVLPSRAPDDPNPGPDPRDRCFRLSVRVSVPLERTQRPGWGGTPEPMTALEGHPVGHAPFVACADLEHGLASGIPVEADHLPAPETSREPSAWERAAAASAKVWTVFWDRSSVALDDELLEQTWYRNMYFLRCAVRPGVTCPGLWANWSYRAIGTAWHGDYHMNYNAQQPFWGVLSGNHPELHMPYVDLVDRLLPVSRAWARDYYGLRGAAFPHSAYPVDMPVNPYPVPTWGWEICETPWTVQSLWWHWLYTRDRTFLERHAFVPLREAVLFIVDYLSRPEAHGKDWGDDRVHVFPTVAPELYGLTPGLRMNRDCLTDLTLIRFLLRAFLDASRILGRYEQDRELLSAVREVLDRLAPLPTAETPEGNVFVSVPGEDPEIVYNVPVPGMPVFPGEEIGLRSSGQDFQLAARSYRRQKLEGGNELVFAALQGARLGLLDLERWKRQIRYCLLPNGTCTDLVLQVHGRYDDETPYDFMAGMGIWFENFALPAVINECLLQSWDGTIVLFPNWPRDRDARFSTLRAVGAFLVSAALAGGIVTRVRIESEAGERLRFALPWAEGTRVSTGGRERIVAGPELEMETAAGQVILLEPAGR